MQRKGITVESFEKIRKKADDYDKIHGVLESIWPSMWNAIKVITNPRLDEYEMNDEEKESIRRALSKNPKNSLANSEWMLRAVKSVREITNDSLFFGFLDGATTISESYGGGGGNNELPKKKDNEDDLSFARRCHQMAKAMHAPRYRLRRG